MTNFHSAVIFGDLLQKSFGGCKIKLMIRPAFTSHYNCKKKMSDYLFGVSGFLPEVFVSFWKPIVSQFSMSPYLTKGMRKSFLIFLVFDGLHGEMCFVPFKSISQWGFSGIPHISNFHHIKCFIIIDLE